MVQNALGTSVFASSAMSESIWDSDARYMFPWFATLSERQVANLKINEHLVDRKSAAECMVDLSQSLKRQHITKGRSGCVLPVGEQWLLARHRLVTGAEKLRLQGIFINHAYDYAPALLGDLAGNAFSATAFRVTFWSLAMALGDLM